MLPFLYTFYRFSRGIWSAFKDPEFQVLLVLTGIVLATGTLFYHESEGWRDSKEHGFLPKSLRFRRGRGEENEDSKSQ